MKMSVGIGTYVMMDRVVCILQCIGARTAAARLSQCISVSRSYMQANSITKRLRNTRFDYKCIKQ